jgi:putative tricarboxylic transport membrane protein
LLAPEIAKNTCIVGDLIPTFTLGIPGSSVTAIFLAAMTVHGIQPGAEFFLRSGALAYTIITGILLAQISFFVMGLLFAQHFAKVVLIPNALLAPLIVVLSFVGSLAFRGRLEDVILTFASGLIGYLLMIRRYPSSCLVLGLVLGHLMEANFHRSILISGGSYSIFFTRPISLTLFLVMITVFVWPYVKTTETRRH